MEIEETKIPCVLNKRQILELAALIHPKIKNLYEYLSIDRILFDPDGVECDFKNDGLCQQGKIIVSNKFAFDMKTLNKDYISMILDEHYPMEDDDDIPDDAWIDDPEALDILDEVIEIYDRFVLNLETKKEKKLWK